MAGEQQRGEPVWAPDRATTQHRRLAEFARHASAITGQPLDDYPALLRWTLDEPDSFWSTFADWIGVRWRHRPTGALASTHMPGTVWFPGGTLNHAEHALAQTGGATAIVSLSQTRERIELSWDELRDAVARCRAGLVRLGIGRGDRVAAFLPNVHETIVAFLATASLGAVWSSCAPEFGARAVIDRWSQLEPTVLFAVDGYRYGAKDVHRRAELTEIVAALPTLQHVVMLPYLHPDPPPLAVPLAAPTITWDECCTPPAAAETGPTGSEPVVFESVPFDHPLYVLFSSGTTGLPKPIVHGHGGITIEHLKVLALHHDLRPGDRFMWFTTTGWMMWNYLVSGLLVGATIVLFDGDPASPDLSTLWQIAADERLDVLGVSAPFLMACRTAGLRPGSTFDLSRLRQVGSTGAPLPADGFRWVRDAVGAHVQPCSVSGGTDVCTAFVGAAPTVPVRAGEISVRMLGCDVRAVDPDGRDCPPGVTGELVITTPLPSMPVGLWGDPTGERLRATYFETFPGRWHHGDWVTFHADGACEITGRSDATLNRGGVRLGTSDFYGVVESLPEVDDSVVVHLEDADGGPGTLILLVACAPDVELDAALRQRVAEALRTELSPRHVPDVIEQVRAVPRTLSGKKLEVPIKRLLLGQPAERVASRGSLADPTALDDLVAWAAAFRNRTTTVTTPTAEGGPT